MIINKKVFLVIYCTITFMFVMTNCEQKHPDDENKRDNHQKKEIAPFFNRDLFRDLFKPKLLFSPITLFLEQTFENPFFNFPSRSLQYEKIEDESKYQISFFVCEDETINPEDIHVEIDNGGRVLNVFWEKEMIYDDNRQVRKWYRKSFTLDKNSDVRNISAKLYPNGKLVLECPKLPPDDLSKSPTKIQVVAVEA